MLNPVFKSSCISEIKAVAVTLFSILSLIKISIILFKSSTGLLSFKSFCFSILKSGCTVLNIVDHNSSAIPSFSSKDRFFKLVSRKVCLEISLSFIGADGSKEYRVLRESRTFEVDEEDDNPV
ncbi:hypothetical protein WICMUC_000903 [Wickerhamomyces mucosus]|uniref:Uncharacterized protein n=1 Tax=Wickerhamomyces mucosus TaxID=1378264 RepID=A0A9P8PXT7_9ASCO|nr:hypothetical protein WICMUC_000903 [Wickerhamomyces mucosus]